MSQPNNLGSYISSNIVPAVLRGVPWVASAFSENLFLAATADRNNLDRTQPPRRHRVRKQLSFCHPRRLKRQRQRKRAQQTAPASPPATPPPTSAAPPVAPPPAAPPSDDNSGHGGGGGDDSSHSGGSDDSGGHDQDD